MCHLSSLNVIRSSCLSATWLMNQFYGDTGCKEHTSAELHTLGDIYQSKQDSIRNFSRFPNNSPNSLKLLTLIKWH